jgi:hypothetical protein
MGYTIDELKTDMVRRIRLIKWMQKNQITDFREVTRYFRLYHTNPEQIDKLVRREQ